MKNEVFDMKAFNDYYVYQNQKFNKNKRQEVPFDYVANKIKDGLKKHHIDINHSAFKPFKSLHNAAITQKYTQALIEFHHIVKESRRNQKQEQDIGYLLGDILEDNPHYFMIDEDIVNKRINDMKKRILDMQELIGDYQKTFSLPARIDYFFQSIFFLMKVYGLSDGGHFFDCYKDDGYRIKKQILKKPKKVYRELSQLMEEYNIINRSLNNEDRTFDSFDDIHITCHARLQCIISYYEEGTFSGAMMNECLTVFANKYYIPGYELYYDKNFEKYKVSQRNGYGEKVERYEENNIILRNAYVNFIAENQFNGYSRLMIESAMEEYEECMEDATILLWDMNK